MSPRLERSTLATAAHDFLRHGWPVAPGAWWSPQLRHYHCGRTGCCVSGPHPVEIHGGTGRCTEPAADCVITTPAAVDRVWRTRSYSLLLPTGRGVSVVEGAPEPLRAVDAWLRGQGLVAPLASSPSEDVLELYCQTLPEDEELWLAAASKGVLLHGPNSWITLPPSATRAGTKPWLRSPAECRWELPPANAVTDGVRRALGLLGADRPAAVA